MHHAMVSTAPGAQPMQVLSAMVGQARALPSASPWLCIKARAPGGAGRLPVLAPSAGSQTGCRTG